MNELFRLVNNLNIYLEHLAEGKSLLESIGTVWSPIITSMAIILGGGFALYKYQKAKNYDINIKVLQEVYAPLYSYFVKQETFREIACSTVSQSKSPILNIERKKTTTHIDEKSIKQTVEKISYFECTTKDFLKVLDKTNLALSSGRLVTLLNMYLVLVDMSEGDDIKKRAKALILREKVERELRSEIISGYTKYRKKLGLGHKNRHKSFGASDNSIYKWNDKGEFLLASEITQEEIDKKVEQIKNRKR